MIFSPAPAMSFEKGFVPSRSGSQGAEGRGFDAFLEKARGLPEKGGAKADPRLSLQAVLDRMRMQLQALTGMGRQDMTVDPEALDWLRQMILGSGLEGDARDTLLDVIENGSRENLSMGRLLDRLRMTSEEMDMELVPDSSGLSLGSLPYIYNFLNDLGVSRERIHTMLDRSAMEGQGFSLDRLGRELALLRQDLSEGGLGGAGGTSGAGVIGVLDSMLGHLRAMGAGGQEKGFSHDTARLLEKSVLAALAGRDMSARASERKAEFHLPAHEVAADFLRQIQPGGRFLGVTEAREAAMGKGVTDSGGQPYQWADMRGGEPVMEATVLEAERKSYLSEKDLIDFIEKSEAKKHWNLKEYLLQADTGGAGNGEDSILGKIKSMGGFQGGDSGEDHGSGSGARPQDMFRAAEKKNVKGEGQLTDPVLAAQGAKGSENRITRSDPAPPPPPPAFVMDQVGRKMADAIRDGQNEVSFQLKPEHLGRLHLRIENIAGVVNIRMLAEQKGTHELLLAQAAELKAQMQEQGMRVERIEVSVSPDFDSALFRERERERESRRSKKSEKNGTTAAESGGRRHPVSIPVNSRDSRLHLMA
ncbi:flagellar hook-length control protein FliK [Desulfobotulus alkaliphilus]|uniref:Flagellar hook-length control protein FliK n=1 Tax=Desulfobotulus alkaliphilus TaxID=622671 RepID=A0A562RTH1_9BACT|nr:flagellar hook-length control protein FliK [Desulfobotulus alkaliphilus]TWI72415.1 flagellar hook-length control protein FliK [Desulfobotulus alkaliphilus]